MITLNVNLNTFKIFKHIFENLNDHYDAMTLNDIREFCKKKLKMNFQKA